MHKWAIVFLIEIEREQSLLEDGISSDHEIQYGNYTILDEVNIDQGLTCPFEDILTNKVEYIDSNGQ